MAQNTELVNFIRHARSNQIEDSIIEDALVHQKGYPEDVVREAMIDPASLSYTEYVRRSQPRQPLPRLLVGIIAAAIVGILSLILLFLI